MKNQFHELRVRETPDLTQKKLIAPELRDMLRPVFQSHHTDTEIFKRKTSFHWINNKSTRPTGQFETLLKFQFQFHFFKNYKFLGTINSITKIKLRSFIFLFCKNKILSKTFRSSSKD